MSESGAVNASDNCARRAGAKNSGKGAAPNQTIRGAAESGRRNWRWGLLLLLPYLGLLWVPFYAKAEPRLWGLPFFYWYQFVWIFLTMFLIEFVRRRTR